MEIISKTLSEQSEQIFVMMGIATFLSIFFVLTGKYIQKQDPMKKPPLFMVLIEIYYSFIKGLVESIFRSHGKMILPYAGMLFIFLLTMNWIGLLLPLKAPATDYSVPLALVLISFGFKYTLEFGYNGIVSHIKSYFDPVPIMFPLNLMDIVAKPLSMSMRLFGNLTSGSLILGVFYSAMGGLQNMILPIGSDLNVLGAVVAPPLHFYFDIFAGFIQAFVFTLLTLVFSSLALDMDELDERKAKKEAQKEIQAEIKPEVQTT